MNELYYQAAILILFCVMLMILNQRDKPDPKPTRAEIDASLREIRNEYQQRPQGTKTQ